VKIQGWDRIVPSLNEKCRIGQKYYISPEKISAVQTALLFCTASATGSGRGFLFLLFGSRCCLLPCLFRGNGCLLLAFNRSLNLFSLFLSADRTPFVTASATACADCLSLFSANCTVSFCASATAAESDTATRRQAAQQTGNAHTSQNLFHFFCVHSFLLF
jgi:hypothetical protein